MEIDRTQKIVPQDKVREHWMHKQAKLIGEKVIDPFNEMVFQRIIASGIVIGQCLSQIYLRPGRSDLDRYGYPILETAISTLIANGVISRILNLKESSLNKKRRDMEKERDSEMVNIGQISSTILTYKGEELELQGGVDLKSGDIILEVPLGIETRTLKSFTDVFQNMTERDQTNKKIIVKFTEKLLILAKELEKNEKLSGVKFVAFPIKKGIPGIDRHPSVKRIRDRGVNVNIFDEYGLKKQGDVEYLFLTVEEIKGLGINPSEEFRLCISKLKELGHPEFEQILTMAETPDSKFFKNFIRRIDELFASVVTNYPYNQEYTRVKFEGEPNVKVRKKIDFISILRNRYSQDGLQVIRISSIGARQFKRFTELIGYDPDQTVKEILDTKSEYRIEKLLYKLRDLISTYSWDLLKKGDWSDDREGKPNVLTFEDARDELGFDKKKSKWKFNFFLKSFGKNIALISLFIALRVGALPQITENVFKPFLSEAENRAKVVNVIPGPDAFEQSNDLTPIWKITAKEGIDKKGYYFTGTTSDYSNGTWKTEGQRYMDMINNLDLNKSPNKKGLVEKTEIVLETVVAPFPSTETVLKIPLKYGFDVSYVEIVNALGNPVEFGVFRLVDNSVEISIKAPYNFSGLNIKVGLFDTKKPTILPISKKIAIDYSALSPDVRVAVEAFRNQKSPEVVTNFWKDSFQYNLFYNYPPAGSTPEDMLNTSFSTEGNCICGICNSYSILSSDGLLSAGLAYLNLGEGRNSDYLSRSESHMTALGTTGENKGKIFDATPVLFAKEHLEKVLEAKREVGDSFDPDLAWNNKVKAVTDFGITIDSGLVETAEVMAFIGASGGVGFLTLRKARQLVEKYKEGRKSIESVTQDIPKAVKVRTDSPELKAIQSVFIKKYPLETLSKVYGVINWFVYGYTNRPVTPFVNSTKFNSFEDFQESIRSFVGDDEDNGGLDISQISDLVDKIDGLPFVKDFTDKEKRALTEIIRFYWE